MKRLLAFILIAVLAFPAVHAIANPVDELIYKDAVANTYTGRPEAADMINNLSFTDVPDELQDAVTRNGALNIIKGYESLFKPDELVSNQDAVAYIMRALGRESNARDAAVTAIASMPADSPLRTLWSIGYLYDAWQVGLLTRAQYNDALVADQTGLNPETNFRREDPVTREQLADWLVRGAEIINQSVFTTSASIQSMLTYSDWTSVAADKARAVEAVTSRGIMEGSGGLFRPKGSVTKADIAQILKNMDSIYYSITSIDKKTGTIGGIQNRQSTDTGKTQYWRDIYVRTSDGQVDILQYQMESSTSPQAKDADAVVLKDDAVTGLHALEDGDKIEYLTQAGRVLYVQTLSSEVNHETITGLLVSTDMAAGTITITSPDGQKHTYPLMKGLYGTNGTAAYIVMSEQKRDTASLPVGSSLELILRNNIVEKITYLGEPILVTEVRGIVVENNTAFGYMTIIDNDGNEITKNYYQNDISVKKTEYYDLNSDISYITEVFPNFKYDPRDTIITAVEPGDIVFIRLDPNDTDTIISISASTNYIARYGRIREFRTDGSISRMLIEYEDKQTSWFDIPNSIYISKEGYPAAYSNVVVGDWARLLLNRALIAPGYVMESVKEITLEGDGHYISNIVKGQLAGLNAVQNQLLVQNAQLLTKAGWSNYKQLQPYSIAAKDIEYYYDDRRITLDYALQYLKRSQGDVYIAMENHFAGEKVKRVTFRSGRDQLLPADTVLSADGNGNFSIIGNNGLISTDAGTIVRRHGRLVDGHNIMPYDYAVVSLNGGNKAAIVDIVETPGVSGVIIGRGRILSVTDGTGFRVQSISILGNTDWNYTPVQREFTIDYNTLFLNTSGYVPNESFLGYTENSVIDKVYNIVMDGSRAARVIDAPYATRAVRGVIYNISGNTVSIKDVVYQDAATGRWIPVSTSNATVVVTVPQNSIIVKNNNVISASGLVAGDQIKVMTDTLPNQITGGMGITGYIIQVEK